MSRIRSFNLPSGTRVGNYVVLELLGRGWEGEVYKVQEVPTESVRALKLFRTDDIGHSGIRYLTHVAWFFEQVHASRRFPTYYHWGQWFFDDDNGCWFLVFEFIEGKNVKKYFPRRSSNELEDIFFNIANALADVHHRCGYAVGDIETLDNVFISKTGQAVFIDCNPGKPDHPNTDFKNDLRELQEIANKFFAAHQPIAVRRLLQSAKKEKKIRSETLNELLLRANKRLRPKGRR